MGNGCQRSCRSINTVESNATTQSHIKKQHTRLRLVAKITNFKLVHGRAQFTLELIQTNTTKLIQHGELECATTCKQSSHIHPIEPRYSSSTIEISTLNRNLTPCLTKDSVKQTQNITNQIQLSDMNLPKAKQDKNAESKTMPNSADVSIAIEPKEEEKYSDNEYPKEINIKEGIKPLESIGNISKDNKTVEITENTKNEINTSDVSTGLASRGTKNSITKVANSSMLSVNCSQVYYD